MLFVAFAALVLVLWAVIAGTLPLLQRSGALAAHLIAGVFVSRLPPGKLADRTRVFVPIVVVLSAGALLTAWAGDGFLDLAEMVQANSPAMQDFDTTVHDWAVSERSPASTAFFLLMTTIGSPAVLAGLGGCVAFALLLTRRYRWLLYFAVTAGGGAFFDWELKSFFARARPDVAEMLRRAEGYSFPSGHAMGSTVVFDALSYLAFRVVHHWLWKSAALACSSALVLAICSSRVYLGVHWISDVAAGLTAGAMWVGVTTVSYETLRRVRLLARHRDVSRSSSRDGPRGA